MLAVVSQKLGMAPRPETVHQGRGGGRLPIGTKLGTSPGKSGAQPCRPVWARLELCSGPRRAVIQRRQDVAASLGTIVYRVPTTGQGCDDNKPDMTPALRGLTV